jgi:hypothetical protein
VAALPTLTRKFFEPLRCLDIEETTENKVAEDGARNSQGNRPEVPPSMIITAQLNLLRLQGEIKASTKGSLEIRNARNGTSLVTKEMADYLAIKELLEEKTLLYIPPQSVKQIKAAIKHLPRNTPAEDTAKNCRCWDSPLPVSGN